MISCSAALLLMATVVIAGALHASADDSASSSGGGGGSGDGDSYERFLQVQPTALDYPPDRSAIGVNLVSGWYNQQANVPVLGRIPLIGNLFRSQTARRTRDSALMLFTPAPVPDVE